MKTILAGIYGLISLAGMFILLNSCEKKFSAEGQPVINSTTPVINPTVNPIPYSVLVYLVTPTDKKIDYNYYNAAKTTMQKLQDWYKTQMGNNKTFVLNPVVVDTLTGLHESSWFLSDHGPEISGSDHYQYNNAKHEIKQLLGSKFDTTLYTYFIYIPAPFDDETYPNGLAAQGLKNLNGLVDHSNLYIGMAAHSLGHGFGLPELPVQTPTGIMCAAGISNYPNSTFTQEEKDSLNAGPFLKVQ